MARFGSIVLFGSGEAAPVARRVHAAVLAELSPPVRARVSGRLADYLRQHFAVEALAVPARKRGTPESPDEPAALLIDFATVMATVFGKGEVTWLNAGHDLRLRAGEPVALERLGLTRRPNPVEAIPRAVWHAACRAHIPGSAGPSPEPADAVRALVSERTAARVRGDWLAADHLRDRIVTAGWQVRDTPDGPLLVHG